MAITKCQGIINLIETIAPKKLAENWDNVGLLVGSGSQEIKKIMVCLDVTDWVVEEAIEKKVDLIVAHHPIIFSGLKKVNTDSVLGRKIIKLIQNNISVYCAHTNYDITQNGLNDLLAQTLGFHEFAVIEVLQNDQGLGLGRLVKLKEKVTALEIVELVKSKLQLEHIRFAGDKNKKIKTIALLNGSGNKFASNAKYAGADLFITGDLQYHEILDSVEMNMCIIDAGHYGTEKIMMENIALYLEEQCRKLNYEVEIIISQSNTNLLEVL